MTRNLIILCLMMVCSASVVMAQGGVKDMRRHVKKGNSLIHKGERDKAYEQYMKAYRLDSTNAMVNYNLATAMFPEEWKIMKPDEKNDSMMQQLLMRSADEHAQENPVRRSMAYHNLGVMHQIRANQTGDEQAKYKQLQQAIEAYKQALRNNPHDDEARYNLVLCQKQLPKGGGQGQNDQNGDQQQEQKKEDQQQKQEQQQEQQQQQQEQQQQQKQNQEWIEQMLNAAEQREKQTRRRLDEQKQQPGKRRTNEKNW